MKAQTLAIGTIIALWIAPLGTAAPQGVAKSEEARLLARLNWQRARIDQLQAQIRALAPDAPTTTTVPGDEALRMGLTAEELRAARGEPDTITRTNARCEIWIYGTTRVTLFGGRVTGWQAASEPTAPAPAPDVTAPTERMPIDELRPRTRPHSSEGS